MGGIGFWAAQLGAVLLAAVKAKSAKDEASLVTNRTPPPASKASDEPPGNDEQIPSASRSEDDKLVKKSMRGDRASYQKLVTKYEKRVYCVVFGMLHNREDALEVTQEAFVKAFLRLKDFAGRSSFYTWTYRIAVNLAIDFRRKEWRRSDRTSEYDDSREDSNVDEETFARGNIPSPHRAHENRELAAALDAALDKLPDDQRSVLIMREIEGMSYQEMADAMGCSIGTIMSRLFYARKKMQAMLQEHL